jgi:predicted RNA-binding Zn ribbon-like protein
VELLTSHVSRGAVRECESDTCAWLFLDRTRNHSRRWCDMGDCGNRAKARRFRERRARYRA